MNQLSTCYYGLRNGCSSSSPRCADQPTTLSNGRSVSSMRESATSPRPAPSAAAAGSTGWRESCSTSSTHRGRTQIAHFREAFKGETPRDGESRGAFFYLCRSTDLHPGAPEGIRTPNLLIRRQPEPRLSRLIACCPERDFTPPAPISCRLVLPCREPFVRDPVSARVLIPRSRRGPLRHDAVPRPPGPGRRELPSRSIATGALHAAHVPSGHSPAASLAATGRRTMTQRARSERPPHRTRWFRSQGARLTKRLGKTRYRPPAGRLRTSD